MKKIIAGILMLAMVFSMAACTGKTPDGPEQKPRPTSMELYNAFLSGEADVYTDGFDFGGFYYDTPDDEMPFIDESYSLSAFLIEATRVRGYEQGGAELQAAEYAFIDCGMDDEPELVLSLNFNLEIDDARDEYVVKNRDGKLCLTAHNENMYRSSEYVSTKYGIINAGGSTGAGGYYMGMYILDENGCKQFIYDAEALWAMGLYYGPEGGIFNIVKKYEDEIPESAELIVYHLKPYEPGQEYSDYMAQAEYGVYDEYLQDSVVNKIFDEAGIDILTENELNDRIKAIAEEKGLPVRVLTADESIEWQPLKNKDVDELIKYGPNPVFVSNTKELFAAINDDTTVVLEPGIYNITEYLRNSIADDLIPCYGEEFYNEPGVCFIGDAEEPELKIYGLYNLKLVSRDASNPAEIVCDPRYALVMGFEDCSGIVLEDLVMGHTPDKGVCSGDVVGFENCYRTKITNCDLYGCGAHGIYAYDCTYLFVKGGTIHDCSYGCISMYNNSYVEFSDVVFADCSGYTMFSLPRSNVYFFGCTFKNLSGSDFLYTDSDSYAYFNPQCIFDASALRELQSYSGPGMVIVQENN